MKAPKVLRTFAARKREAGRSSDSKSSCSNSEDIEEFLSLSFSDNSGSFVDADYSRDDDDDTIGKEKTLSPSRTVSQEDSGNRYVASPTASYASPMLLFPKYRYRAREEAEAKASAAAAADALGKDLEAMGYNLDCKSFLTKGRSSSTVSNERYAAGSFDSDIITALRSSDSGIVSLSAPYLSATRKGPKQRAKSSESTDKSSPNHNESRDDIPNYKEKDERPESPKVESENKLEARIRELEASGSTSVETVQKGRGRKKAARSTKPPLTRKTMPSDNESKKLSRSKNSIAHSRDSESNGDSGSKKSGRSKTFIEASKKSANRAAEGSARTLLKPPPTKDDGHLLVAAKDPTCLPTDTKENETNPAEQKPGAASSPMSVLSSALKAFAVQDAKSPPTEAAANDLAVNVELDDGLQSEEVRSPLVCKTKAQLDHLSESKKPVSPLASDIIYDGLAIPEPEEMSMITANESADISVAAREKEIEARNVILANKEASQQNQHSIRAKLTRAKLLKLSKDQEKAKHNGAATLPPTASPHIHESSQRNISTAPPAVQEDRQETNAPTEIQEDRNETPEKEMLSGEHVALPDEKDSDAITLTPKAKGSGTKILRFARSLSPQKRPKKVSETNIVKEEKEKPKRRAKKEVPSPKSAADNEPIQRVHATLRPDTIESPAPVVLSPVIADDMVTLGTADTATLVTSESTAQITANTPVITLLASPKVDNSIVSEERMKLENLIITPKEGSSQTNGETGGAKKSFAHSKPPKCKLPMGLKSAKKLDVKDEIMKRKVRFSFFNKKKEKEALIEKAKRQRQLQLETKSARAEQVSEKLSFESMGASIQAVVAETAETDEGVEVVVFRNPDAFSPLSTFGPLDKIDEVDSHAEAGSALSLDAATSRASPRSAPTRTHTWKVEKTTTQEAPTFEIVLGDNPVLSASGRESPPTKSVKQPDEDMAASDEGAELMPPGCDVCTPRSTSAWRFMNVFGRTGGKATASTVADSEETSLAKRSVEGKYTRSVQTQDMTARTRSARTNDMAARTRSGQTTEMTDRTRSEQTRNTVSTAGYTHFSEFGFTQHSEYTNVPNSQASIHEKSLAHTVTKKSNSLFDAMDCFCFGPKASSTDLLMDETSAPIVSDKAEPVEDTVRFLEEENPNENASVRSGISAKASSTRSRGISKIAPAKAPEFSEPFVSGDPPNTSQDERTQTLVSSTKPERSPSIQQQEQAIHFLNNMEQVEEHIADQAIKNPKAAKIYEQLLDVNESALDTKRIAKIDRIPSHLILNRDNDGDDDGSCLTSLAHSTVMGRRRKNADGTDVSTVNTLEIADAAAWDEIAAATLIIDEAIKRIDASSGNLVPATSYDSTVGGDVEGALLTLKRHSERLGVKESDLLLAMKSQDETEVHSPSRQTSTRSFIRANNSSTMKSPHRVHDGETVTVDGTMNSMTIGEEILEVFKIYLAAKAK